MRLLQRAGQFSKSPKNRSNGILVTNEWGHRHQAGWPQTRPGKHQIEQRWSGCDRASSFLLFAGNVDFQQDLDRSAYRFELPSQSVDQ